MTTETTPPSNFVETVIVGAGPVGIFQIFELGLLGIGSVITYQLVSGKPEVATHRVVAIARNPDGRVRFQTRGDANNGPDPKWVRPEQVRGKLWYAVPGLGRVGSFLTGEQRQRAIQIVAVLLIGYALVTFVGAARRRRGTRR